MWNARRSSVLLIAILLASLALILRLKAAGALPVDHDERAYFPASQRYSIALMNRDWTQIIEDDFNSEHPPLVKIFYGVVLASSGEGSLTYNPRVIPYKPFHLARVSSAILGGLQVLFLAVINPLAGFFLAIHTWQIKYTSQIMLESLPSLTSLLAVIAYQKSGGKRNSWLLLSALTLGLSAASKYIYALVGIAIVIHWFWGSRSEAKSIKIAEISRWITPVMLWGLISLNIFFLVDPHLWRYPFDRLLASLIEHRSYIQMNISNGIVFPFWQPLVWLSRSAPSDPGAFYFAIDPVITFLALLGTPRLIRKHLLFAIWLIVGLVFLFAWPTKWPQYILVLTVPLAVSASEGVQSIIFNRYTRRITGFFQRRRPIRIPVGNESSVQGTHR